MHRKLGLILSANLAVCQFCTATRKRCAGSVLILHLSLFCIFCITCIAPIIAQVIFRKALKIDFLRGEFSGEIDA